MIRSLHGSGFAWRSFEPAFVVFNETIMPKTHVEYALTAI
jgi:hypothetical protein